MRLKELARNELSKEKDYQFRYLYGHTPVFNDISWATESESLRVERFRFSHDAIFSLKIDGEQVPFARVNKARRSIFPHTYKAHVEILPCMIPQAIGALASYTQTDLFISSHEFSKEEVVPYIREIQAVQRELYNILETNAFEGRPKEPYMQRKINESRSRSLSFIKQ